MGNEETRGAVQRRLNRQCRPPNVPVEAGNGPRQPLRERYRHLGRTAGRGTAEPRVRNGSAHELDLPNVVEEIEDVGNSQLRSVNSFMRLILSHLILIAVDADADTVPHWKTCARSRHFVAI